MQAGFALNEITVFAVRVVFKLSMVRFKGHGTNSEPSNGKNNTDVQVSFGAIELFTYR